MYTNIYYNRVTNQVTLFHDNHEIETFKYEPTFYELDDSNTSSSSSPIKTIFGKSVRKIKKFSKAESVFETDLDPRLRVLVDRFYDTSEVAKNNICYLDIEVDTTDQKPTVALANNKITCIGTCLNNQYVLFLLCNPEKEIKYSQPNLIIKRFTDESEMLLAFARYLKLTHVSIITDYNGDYFDIPYIVNRMSRLGLNYKLLSPIQEVEIKEESFISIAGISHLDFLKLYKKYSVNDRSSYKLDAIANVELGIGKIQHNGLDNLYEHDIDRFIEYNIRDIELVQKLEAKLRYIQIAIYLAHKVHIPYEWIFSQSKIIEGGFFTFFKKNGLVSINKPNRTEQTEEKIEGAYVKDPQPGLYKKIIDLDFTSLYPNIIRTLNVSPEKKVGKIANWKKFLPAFYSSKNEPNQVVTMTSTNGDVKEINLAKLRTILEKNNMSIACNGVMYKLNEPGFIPQIVSEWFAERVEFKNKKFAAKKQNNTSEEIMYDIMQYVMKILMNTLYGVLALPSFRYYDRDMAESITITGQNLIKQSEKNVNRYLGHDNVVYGDTDSLFVTLDGYREDEDIKQVCSDLQNYANKCLETVCKKMLNVDENKYLSLKQEIIASSLFILSKKHYALWCIDEEGIKPKDGYELKVKGIEMVKSSFPKSMQELFSDILKDILQFKTKDVIDQKIKQFYAESEKVSVLDMAITTGIKDLEKYQSDLTNYIKGSPAHVKAALNYNQYLKLNNLTDTHNLIQSGDKIKYVYLTRNPYDFKTIAFLESEISPEIDKFLNQYVDRTAIMESVLENKIKTFYDALNWSLPNTEPVDESYF